MAQVLGVGGVFFACKDTDATKDWYVRVLGMTAEAFGGFVFQHARSAGVAGERAYTVFSPFAADSDYFAPSDLPFMFNLMVDDLDGMLARARGEGVSPLQPVESNEFGRFAWILDPDGRKIELWQPPV